MKFTLGWLKEHLKTDASLEEICDTLTAIGLEVEEVTDHGEALKDFVVAEIQAAERHPDADKLQLCKVFDGKDTYSIVCGAPNARPDLKTVLAREGVHIPGAGFTIKKTKIRGVESCGMLCSASELGVDEDSDGILELPEDSAPGSSAAEALGLNDPTIEIAITPNRADCLGVYGIARDLAAAGVGKLIPLEIPALASSGTSKVKVSLNTPACPLFVGCTISGVKNPESPAWLKQRLRAIGLRPISTLVDITNYITFTYGRPLHVYDVKKLKGDINVRASKKGEHFEALNDKEYTLEDGMTAITDDSGVLGLGGIIGGTSTGCDDTTTEVFLETAWFDPVDIATTGRKLEILSDARYRFERGVDPDFVASGAAIATQMILDLCGGNASEFVIAGHAPKWSREITFNSDHVASRGGVPVSHEESRTILEHLGFEVHGTGKEWKVHPPSWRADVEGSADLIEEILRIHGYDAIPVTPLPKAEGISKPVLTHVQKQGSRLRRLLASKGYREVVSWSFLPEEQAKRFGGGDSKLKLVNPISSELDMMRPNLLPNLLTAAAFNHNRGTESCLLFEAGNVYAALGAEGQKLQLAGIRTGKFEEYSYPDKRFERSEREANAFDAKADAETALQALGVNIEQLQVKNDAPAWYHPGRSGQLTLGGKIILADFGELHPAILGAFDIKGRASAFELHLDAIPAPRSKSGKSKPALNISPYPAVSRDFAFIIDDNISVAELQRAVRSADKKLVQGVHIFDLYRGNGVEDGKKSVALGITLQSNERTLTDEDIKSVSDAVVSAAGKLGATLRS